MATPREVLVAVIRAEAKVLTLTSQLVPLSGGKRHQVQSDWQLVGVCGAE